MTKTAYKKILEKIVKKIVETAYPEKIILFGSRARGNNKKESDFDFMVIKKGVKNERDISRRIYRALFEERLGVSVDIIVVDKDKLERNKKNSYLIYSSALKEGEIVYG